MECWGGPCVEFRGFKLDSVLNKRIALHSVGDGVVPYVEGLGTLVGA